MIEKTLLYPEIATSSFPGMKGREGLLAMID
jgi:hypothetical protein